MQGRDSLPLLMGIDWTPVLVALITLSGVIFNGLVGLFVWWQLRTPSKKMIGKQVESAHLTVLGNNYILQSVARKLGVMPEPVPASPEEAANDDAG